MKIVKNILLTLLGLIVLLIIVSFFLPSKSHVQRSLQMNAKADQVYKLVNNFKNWGQWSPWHQIDTTTVYTYNNIEEGVGASYSWKSNHKNVGSGSMTVLEATPNEKWHSEMTFDGMGSSYADFTIQPNDSGLYVTWSMDSDGKGMPFYMFPMHKIMSLFIDKMVGPDFEKGLKNIKTIVENQPAASLTIAGFEAEFKDLPAMEYIGIRAKIKGAEISAKLGEFYGLLMAEVKKQGVEQAGPPFTINYSANGDEFDMEACISVKTSMVVNGKIKSGNKPAGKALVIKYLGNYNGVGKVYQSGFEYLGQNNLKASGAPMEFYITDPMNEKDTAKWLTEVVFPCM